MAQKRNTSLRELVEICSAGICRCDILEPEHANSPDAKKRPLAAEYSLLRDKLREVREKAKSLYGWVD